MNRQHFKVGIVRLIREDYTRLDTSLADLAEKYDRTRQSIHNIVRGHTYTDYPGPIAGVDYEVKSPTGSAEYSSTISVKVTDELRERLESLHQQGSFRSLSDTIRTALEVGAEELESSD